MEEASIGVRTKRVKPFYAEIPRCVILDRTITPTIFRLYCYIVARVNNESNTTWVSQQTISDDLGIARQHINRNLKVLASRGLLEISKTEDGSRNVYELVPVEEIYHEAAVAPWPRSKRSPTTPCDHPGTYQQGDTPRTNKVTPPVPTGLHPPVPTRLHKETEAHDSEFKVQKERSTPPSAKASRGTPTPPSPAEFEAGSKWLNHAKEMMPWCAANGRWTAEGFAQDIAKLKAKTDLNDHGVREVLEFIRGDEFWIKNAISPASLLGKSRNGIRKIDNLLLSMRSSKPMKAAIKESKIQTNLDKLVAELERNQ